MACSHASCDCMIVGCGIKHPPRWKPAMVVRINTMEVGGDDLADCMAHYLLRLGYPNDEPERVRRMGERMAARRSSGLPSGRPRSKGR